MHRIQRVPDTEKKGRRHSSTVILTVTGSRAGGFVLVAADLVESFHRSSGKGGQNVNRSSNEVRLLHVPSGVQVVANGKSQWQNRQECRTELARRLIARAAEVAGSQSRLAKNAQTGGGRGDSTFEGEAALGPCFRSRAKGDGAYADDRVRCVLFRPFVGWEHGDFGQSFHVASGWVAVDR